MKKLLPIIILGIALIVHPTHAQGFTFSKLLRKGASGQEVRQLQQLLRGLPAIYPEGLVTGYFGVLTEKSLKKFQTQYHIKEIGMLGPATRKKLNELLAHNPQSAASPSPTPPAEQSRPCPSPTATGCEGQSVSSVFDPSNGKCVGHGPVLFGASPFKLDQLEIIEPMGQTVGGHVTPIDHGYMFGHGTPDVLPNAFDIQSPAKGYVVDISRTQRGAFSDYALTIEFSCTLYVHYSNMTSFAAKLLQAAGGIVSPNETKNFRVPVEEGELVGRTGAYGIDLYVWDLEKTLTGFINQKSYSESWKIHSAQFFDYLKEPLKTQLLAKDVRPVEPRFGKIDYDIDGKLVGNWFQKGTNGYLGLNHGGEGYWTGHLSLAYDALDPTGIVISIGNWTLEAAQFGVRGNIPDPKDVGIDAGMIKYELLQLDWVQASTGARWDHRNFIPDPKFKPIDSVPNAVKGVLLVQLVEPRVLKAETFPGKTAAEVSGFTDNALIYER